MFDIPGLKSRIPLEVGPEHVLVRAATDDGSKLVLSTRHGHPSPRAIAQLGHAHRLLERLPASAVVRATGLVRSGSGLALLLEDDGGGLIPPDRIDDLGELLDVALGATRALIQIHSQGVLHKDIRPGTLWRSPDGTIKLLGFGVAAPLWREETGGAEAPEHLEGTLSYMAPEQSGRTARAVDLRADLYALGATLYHLAVGQPPFLADEPLELLHHHLAVEPVPPGLIRQDLPDDVEGVLLRLMAKDPEDRYRSAVGLAHDLSVAREQVTRGEPVAFPIGAKDLPQRFTIPARLYGRDDEVRRLHGAFERVAAGQTELLLVHGRPGIGKSALINQVRHKLGTRGVFLSGKYDQFRRSVPYSGLAQVLRAWVRGALTEPAERLKVLRRRLQKAVEPNGQDLVDLVPSLQLVLGPQPALPILGPTEREERFFRAMRSLIAALARPGQPMVLFVDDLQWADPASLKLLRHLLADAGLTRLLVIGAFRDNEVGPGHPLELMLGDLDGAAVAVERIALGPLGLDAVTELVEDSVYRSAQPLAQLVLEKTGGNPFFAREFLSSLARLRLLRLEAGLGQWTWDLEGIQARELTDNVVELMTERIQHLPEGTGRLLEAAACLGSGMQIGTLAQAAGLDLDTTRALLEPALRELLLVPTDGDYKYDSAHESGLRFRHDRVQQAAYERISEERRPHLHLRIGRLLRDSDQGDDRLFDVVGHLNQATELLESSERLELARLDLEAAVRAKHSAAYRAAEGLAATGIRMLGAQGWSEHHALNFSLHMERAESALLADRREVMEACLEAAESHAEQLDERVRLLELRIVARNVQGNYAQGLELSLDVLELLGEPLPADPQPQDLMPALARIWELVDGRDPTELDTLPDLTDANKIAAMGVLANTVASVYFIRPALHPHVVFKMVEITLSRGVCADSATAFVVFALVLAAYFGDHQQAQSFGQLALRTLDRCEAESIRARVTFLYDNFVRHWVETHDAAIESLQSSSVAALASGDLEYFGYCHAVNGVHRLFAGRELAGSLAHLRRLMAETDARKQHKSTEILRSLLTAGQRCRGTAEDLAAPWDAREQATLDASRTTDPNLVAHMLMVRMASLVWAGRGAEALEIESDLSAVLVTMAGGFQHNYVRWSGILARLWTQPDLSDAESQAVHEQLVQDLVELGGWAQNNPSVFGAKASLLRAELARVDGNVVQAMAAYEDSARAARAVGNLIDEALTHQLAARFHLRDGRESAARSHLLDARHAWRMWGADALADALEIQHPVLLATEVQTGQVQDLAQLDLEAVLEASHSLSGALRVSDLMARLMRLTVGNAGAERGILLLLDQDGERMTLAARTQGDVVRIPDPPVAVDKDLLPLGIARFAARTGEPVVLADASQDPLFGGEPYVVAHHSRSVLCAPLMHQGSPLGLLYLENSLVEGAFTSARVRLVRVLATQAAISIQNARLYERQVALVRAQARFVPTPFLETLGRRNIQEVALGDHALGEMSILFSDIRGFTTLVESLTPTQSLAFINTYLGRMEPNITRHGGFVDSYIGDAIMALFRSGPDAGLQAAIGMQHALQQLNLERAEQGLAPVVSGIGLNTGVVMMGTIGAEGRVRCGVIGDPVNVAARVESLTKTYSASILVTGELVERLEHPQHVQMRLIDRVMAKGKVEPLNLYEVLDGDTPPVRAAKLANRERVQLAQEHYRKKEFAHALILFEQCRAEQPLDPLPKLMSDRCKALLTQGVPLDWDGVYHLTHK